MPVGAFIALSYKVKSIIIPQQILCRRMVIPITSEILFTGHSIPCLAKFVT
jgi:hypothetical protein